MEFVKLIDKIRDAGLEWHLPACCAPETSSYSLLRAQIFGSIFFCPEGVHLNAEHDAKCRALLAQARQKNHDLVLFPEYCVSYELLGEIAENPNLWPANRKLWVLPCQGVSTERFGSFLKQYADRSNVFILDMAWDQRKVNLKLFVNALFYCFVAYREEETVLCLVPQLKTHPMADHDCLCETPGMTTGEVIFTLNDRLLTLLCADSLHNEITWQRFQSEGLTGWLTILHPQLNPAPKNSVFARLRWDLYEHNEPGVYITCNWAKGTTLSSPGEETTPKNTIRTSWSCIYRKHTDDISQKWLQKDELRLTNERYGLFGALMSTRRTEVWFTLYHEHALALNMPNPGPHGYALAQLPDFRVSTQYSYNPQIAQWIATDTLADTLRQRIHEKCHEYPELEEYCEDFERLFSFPLDTSKKYDADRFFALTIGESPKNVLEIDRDENLIAWTQLLEESDLERATQTMAELLRLSHMLYSDSLKKLAQCDQLTKNPHFCYQPKDDSKPSINLQTDDAALLVALAREGMGARKHLKYLKKTECHDDDDLVRRFIRILYQDPRTEKLCCLPEMTTDITCGESIIREGEITDGGKEPDF